MQKKIFHCLAINHNETCEYLKLKAHCEVVHKFFYSLKKQLDASVASTLAVLTSQMLNILTWADDMKCVCTFPATWRQGMNMLMLMRCLSKFERVFSLENWSKQKEKRFPEGIKFLTVMMSESESSKRVLIINQFDEKGSLQRPKT